MLIIVHLSCLWTETGTGTGIVTALSSVIDFANATCAIVCGVADPFLVTGTAIALSVPANATAWSVPANAIATFADAPCWNFSVGAIATGNAKIAAAISANFAL
jgi:hypothetical protein